MDNEKKLNAEMDTYRDLARKNKKIDVAALAVSALESNRARLVPPGQRRMAYLVSLGLPPLGLLFAAKYYIYSAEDDARRVANICVILTVISLLSAWLIGKLFLGGIAGNSGQLDQLQNIDLNNFKGLIN